MICLNYGGGVNSTAILVQYLSGAVRDADLHVVFADTGDEKEETYRFIAQYVEPACRRKGFVFATVRPPETVLQRWQRLNVVGSRKFRACTDHAKRKPISRYFEENLGMVRLIGIDAGEKHRAIDMEGVRYPLLEQGTDRAGCVEIIKAYGWPVPVKSGCWHCPFCRVGEVLALCREQPEKAKLIADLERAAFAARGEQVYQWGDKPVSYWMGRARQEQLPFDRGVDEGCMWCHT